jgi:NTP pyrophosphatase (non-canonical NTP hydrolase)
VAHIQKLGMINMVMEERGKLTTVAKELVELLDSIGKDDKQESPKYTDIRKKILDLLKHLTNIAGFCDQGYQDRIREITEVVTKSIKEEINLDSIRKVCGLAVGLQVDFNRSPFMITEFDLNVLGNEFRNIFKK